MKGRIELTIPADMSGLKEILDGVAILLEEQGFPFELISDVQLATDEAVTNAILHGYDGKEGEVRVISEADDQEVVVIVEDGAPAFDPVTFVSRDVSLDGDDRPIGGLGLILIRSVMDEVGYRHEDGKNIFTMVKRRGSNTAPE
ncbi:MAG: ATP-binding protein [Methanomicrobiales archaeon]